MAHPVFFSVASQDIVLAERIFERYTGDLIYVYTKSGKNGTWIWDEIEREELPFAKAVVIFWSKNFLNNEGTVRELALAASRFAKGQLREFTVIRCDDTPLFAKEMTGVLTDQEKKVFSDLEGFLRHKRSDRPKILFPEACRLVDDIVSRIERPAVPLQPRPILQQDLKDSARIDRFTFRPSMWVSGLNGYGRKTLIREFFREIDSNATAVEIDVDETSLPDQILLRLESELFDLDMDGLQQEAKNQTEVTGEDVAEFIEKAASLGRFVVFRQSRIYEEKVRLPEWVQETIRSLETGRNPKLFIVAQLPVQNELLVNCGDKLGSFRMMSMEPLVAQEFAWKMINALGGNRQAWDELKVSKIASDSGGNPELIVAIVRLASRLPDLGSLDDIIGKEAQRFSDTMTHLVGWAFMQLDGHDEAKRALLFMHDVNPVSLEDIQSFLDTASPASQIMTRLSNLGLVEQSNDTLFRISPLLSHRLGDLLVTPELLAAHREAMASFANKPLDILDGEHGYLRIETKIKATLFAGKLELAPELKNFVSYAHYFQIGVRLYNARRFHDAAPLLKLAFTNRAVFSLNASIETARFFALVSIRLHHKEDADLAISFLRSRYQGHYLADYVEGERYKYQKRYEDAINCFHKAQKYAADPKNKDTTREERILRPYLDCILLSRFPNYNLARQLADRNVRLNKTVFSLALRSRVYLHNWYHASDLENDRYRSEYDKACQELRDDPGGFSFYCQTKSEEAEMWEDFSEAIEWAQQAYNANPRFDLRLRLWGVKYRSEELSQRQDLIAEIERFCADRANRSEASSYGHAILERYARALKANSELQQFRLSQLGLPLKAAEVRSIFISVSHYDNPDVIDNL